LFVAELCSASAFLDQTVDKLAESALRAGRKQISSEDVKAVMKKQKMISDDESLEQLIRENLTDDLVEKLIPVPRAQNRMQ
jgi:hypothetical protein